MDIINQVSTEAIRKATGKSWDEWLAILDTAGAKKLEHKKIVRLLQDTKLIESGWWQQQVTVGYEIARGKRVTGQTADAGFEIMIQRTLPMSAAEVWALIKSPEGIKIWLGNVPRLNITPGEKYWTPDGTSGEIRTVNEEQHLRMTWRPKGWNHHTTLQIRITPQGDKASVSFHHERLAGERERERMMAHWRDVLENLATEITTR